MTPNTRKNRRNKEAENPKPRDKAAPYTNRRLVPEQPRRQPPDIQDVLNFYDRELIPKEKVCPFSNPCRSNPCTTHAIPRKRKDIIQNHLLHIKFQGYDEQHPANDPLWDSWEVSKYWLVSRPPALTNDEDKKAARSKAAKKSYRSRVEREEREAADRKRQYEEGKITFAEYKRVLVGDKRRKAEYEHRMKQLEGDIEKLQRDMEQKIQQLTSKQTPAAPLSISDQQQIAALEASIQNIKASRDRLELIREEIVNLCMAVVRCWGQSEKATMLSSEDAFMAGMAFPTEADIAGFYQYAALLQSPMVWHDRPFKGTHVRSMKKALQAYSQDLRSEIDPNDEDAEIRNQQIDDLVANFNACCDIVENDEKRAKDSNRLQEWLDVQDRLWSQAKDQPKHYLGLVKGWRAPIQTARIIDKFVDVIRAFARESCADEQISSAAKVALHGRNGQGSSVGDAE